MTPLHNIRGLLFDKDGTILDYALTWTPINRAVAAYAARGDVTVRDRILSRGGHDPITNRVAAGSLFAGGSVEEIIAHCRDVAGSGAPGDLDVETERLFRDGGAAHSVLIPGVFETLVRLKAERFELGLATNDTAAGLEASLARFGLLPLFDFTCGADSGFGTKPGPGMVEAFCRVTSLPAADVAVIGDSIHDLEMARRAGAGLRIAVLSGTSGRSDLEDHADLVVESVTALPQLFGTSTVKPKRMMRPWNM